MYLRAIANYAVSLIEHINTKWVVITSRWFLISSLSWVVSFLTYPQPRPASSTYQNKIKSMKYFIFICSGMLFWWLYYSISILRDLLKTNYINTAPSDAYTMLNGCGGHSRSCSIFIFLLILLYKEIKHQIATQVCVKLICHCKVFLGRKLCYYIT